MKVALIGNGYLGKAYHKVFDEAVVYDEPARVTHVRNTKTNKTYTQVVKEFNIENMRKAVNECDIAMIAVPTDPLSDGSLDMSIVEEVVDWLETDLILIKSALMPGTVDRLVKKTGKKIAVSVEYIGMGNYYLPPDKYPDPLDPQKHKLLVVGGEPWTAQACAEILWSKMSPDTRIHIVNAKEAEITKLIENFYGALKVTFANCLYNLCSYSGGALPIRVHQAWSEDGRVDPMHTRVVKGKRGWKSHCYDKDIQALGAYAKAVGSKDMQELVDTIIGLNKGHLKENDKG